MKKQHLFSILLILIIFSSCFSQNNKGTIYGFYGWNRGWYSDSDIRFYGDNYDITLDNVTAQDRVSKWNVRNYLIEITLPQTNARIGYFLDEHYDISIGLDHMKYVMTQDQTVNMNGEINTGGAFDGTYVDQQKVLTYSFLSFEHTDGLNYINVEFRRNDEWYKIKSALSVNSILGISAGGMLPKTNAGLWHRERYDDFHWSGFGLGIVTGLKFKIYKYGFLQAELKGGYINMPDIRTSQISSDRASQAFFFSQLNMLVGFNIPTIWNKKTREDSAE